MSILIAPGTSVSKTVTKTVTDGVEQTVRREHFVNAAGVGVVKQKVRTKIPYGTETVVETATNQTKVVTTVAPGVVRVKHRTRVDTSNVKTQETVVNTETKTTTVAPQKPAYEYHYVYSSGSGSGSAPDLESGTTAATTADGGETSGLTISSSASASS